MFEYGERVALFLTQVAVSGSDIYPGGLLSTAQYDVAADGRFLMNVDAPEGVPPIKVVLNWTARLTP